MRIACGLVLALIRELVESRDMVKQEGATMRIRELAERTGHTPETIRWYEKVGLLEAPVREPGNNYRQYGAKHLSRLAFIRRCRSLDMGLEDIRVLLTAIGGTHGEAAKAAHALVAKHLAEVERRMDDLQALKKDLEHVAHRCGGDHADGRPCGILEELHALETR